MIGRSIETVMDMKDSNQRERLAVWQELKYKELKAKQKKKEDKKSIYFLSPIASSTEFKPNPSIEKALLSSKEEGELL